jgi:hypothetical protein
MIREGRGAELLRVSGEEGAKTTKHLKKAKRLYYNPV